MGHYVPACTRINELPGFAIAEKYKWSLVNAHDVFLFPSLPVLPRTLSSSLSARCQRERSQQRWKRGSPSYLRIDIASLVSWTCPLPRRLSRPWRIGGYQYSLSGSCIIQAWPQLELRRTFEGRQVFLPRSDEVAKTWRNYRRTITIFASWTSDRNRR